MKEDWPHLDILSDKQALLGTDSRLKLIEAVLYDVRRRVEELNDAIAAAGERLQLVEGNLPQQKQGLLTSSMNSSQSMVMAQGKKTFPSPPADDHDALHEDVAFLRQSVEKESMKREQDIISVQRQLDTVTDLRHSVEKETRKREQEIISVQRQLDGFRDSYKRLTEWKINQQSAVDGCLLRLENCESSRDSIQMLISAELEIRERLEELQHNVQSCLLKQNEDAESTVSKGSKPGRNVNPLLTSHVAKLSRDIAGVTERMASLELCLQGSALERQDSSTSNNTVVNDIRRLQLSVATISRSVNKVTKEVFDMRASEVTSRSSTATSLSSILTNRSKFSERPSISKVRAQLPEKSPPEQTSPGSPSLSIPSSATRLPYKRPSGTWPDRAPGSEEIASEVSTSTQSVSPLNTSRDSPGQLVAARLALSKFGMARGALSAVPEDSRSATFGPKTTAQSSLTEPMHADRFSLRPRLSQRQQRQPSHLPRGDKRDLSVET